MVFHPQEFGNVATCCAYLEGAGLGPGAAVARSDGVAWRRVSINYSHNYNRRPAASPAFAIAIALSSELQCNCGWNARPNASKARGVSFHGIYQTIFIRVGDRLGLMISRLVLRYYSSIFVALSWLSRVIAWGGSLCNVIMTNSTKGESGKSVKIRVLQWFSMDFEGWEGDDLFY